MTQTVSTILFDGQFWMALIERCSDNGKVQVARYIFGPQPTNNDLLDFYLNRYSRLRFHSSEEKIHVKKSYSHKRLERGISKSYSRFKDEQKKYLQESKKNAKAEALAQADEKYRLKQQKKKEKNRGR